MADEKIKKTYDEAAGAIRQRTDALAQLAAQQQAQLAPVSSGAGTAGMAALQNIIGSAVAPANARMIEAGASQANTLQAVGASAADAASQQATTLEGMERNRLANADAIRRMTESLADTERGFSRAVSAARERESRAGGSRGLTPGQQLTWAEKEAKAITGLKADYLARRKGVLKHRFQDEEGNETTGKAVMNAIFGNWEDELGFYGYDRDAIRSILEQTAAEWENARLPKPDRTHGYGKGYRFDAKTGKRVPIR